MLKDRRADPIINIKKDISSTGHVLRKSDCAQILPTTKAIRESDLKPLSTPIYFQRHKSLQTLDRVIRRVVYNIYTRLSRFMTIFQTNKKQNYAEVVPHTQKAYPQRRTDRLVAPILPSPYSKQRFQGT